MNERAALETLLRLGPLSRDELDRSIGLSKPAAADLLRRLEVSGLVCRSGLKPVSGPGPQAQLWSANVRAGYAAGISVGANSVSVAIADLGDDVVAADRRPLRATHHDPVDVVRAAVTRAAETAALSLDDLAHTVVGIQGSVDPSTGHLEYAMHLPWWQGFDVEQHLSDALGGPVTVENDVNLVTIDEVATGSGRNRRDVILLWMSHGVAVASIVDGRLVRGGRGGAGEIDHLRIPTGTGPPEPIAALLTNHAVTTLAQRFGASGSTVASTVRRAVRTSPQFVDALAGRVAAAAVGAVALLDPELVILAGDVAVAAGEPLAARTENLLHETLAHRPQVAVAGGTTDSVRQGALHAAVRIARERVFGRGVAVPGGHIPFSLAAPDRRKDRMRA
ncbi:MAG TPA: ROK family transcriptional regulator [Mycobacteriales bacterium]|jgi:predicted NBD/HSP70 family sugar kinase